MMIPVFWEAGTGIMMGSDVKVEADMVMAGTPKVIIIYQFLPLPHNWLERVLTINCYYGLQSWPTHQGVTKGSTILAAARGTTACATVVKELSTNCR